MESFEWQIETKLGFKPLMALYGFFFKPKGYKKLTTHSIYLSRSDGWLYYRAGDVTGWRIKPGTVLRLISLREKKYHNTFTGYLAELHTLDNDKYMFQCDLSPVEFERMESLLTKPL